eukprot:CAMPEP_0119152340 /NCGR_PEP_ID=MMETSP1310-20130426/47656_1 /TAXON_ID=464262 /ORGANISM="Genus nov. species nov., Strain RCC2339" /LENGTH=116 /DNA_ID=CAMNT_0007144693 /DNA_START=175 /DNA_END=522 /DNA_ORIENTATION=+
MAAVNDCKEKAEEGFSILNLSNELLLELCRYLTDKEKARIAGVCVALWSRMDSLDSFLWKEATLELVFRVMDGYARARTETATSYSARMVAHQVARVREVLARRAGITVEGKLLQP